MKHLTIKKIAVIVALALVIWTICGAAMFAGMALASMTVALIAHAVAAPIVAAAVSWFYFKRFHYTSPLVTAVFFTAVVILMDVVVVALLIEKSFEMFGSILGTWIPFALIFTATYVTGRRLEEDGEVVTAVSLSEVEQVLLQQTNNRCCSPYPSETDRRDTVP